MTAQMDRARQLVHSLDDAQTRGSYQNRGQGVGIAFLDTGVAPVDDLVKPVNRIAVFRDFINNRGGPYDDNGHGTHVAGIAAGNGLLSGGKYRGIAPECRVIGVKVLDRAGHGNSGDVLAGLQWVLDNRKAHNIRVCNLSIGTMDVGCRDPLLRGVEALWDAGVVLTVAAGNNGPRPGSCTSPGVSRKVLTVGSSDDDNLVEIWDSKLVNFSGRGPTSECIVKPDVIAPGSNIISLRTPTPQRPPSGGKVVSPHYVKMSGTSMSTPMVAGAVALLLEKYPELSPDEVKLRLKKSACDMNYPSNQQGWGMLNIAKLLNEGIELNE